MPLALTDRERAVRSRDIRRLVSAVVIDHDDFSVREFSAFESLVNTIETLAKARCFVVRWDDHSEIGDATAGSHQSRTSSL
jgi:hypothetical protein